MKVKWIFFDVGSTLVDETAAYDHRAREMIQGTEITFCEFDSKRKELAAMGHDGNSEAIKFFGLKKTPWHSEDEVLFSDAAETLKQLKKRGYHLGIIANQPLGTEKRLDERGVLQVFDVVAASAELGVAKPNAEIFQRALEMAGCLSSNAVMVGDRYHDIVGGKENNLATIGVLFGYGDRSEMESHGADVICETVAELQAVLLGNW